MTAADRPVIRLKPKAKPQAIRHGFPWVYADELVTDRRTSKLAGGTLAVLEDSERRPLGLAAVNPASKIIARVIDADPTAEIGEAWLRERIARALAHRERLFEAAFYRLVHAEADGLPGVVVDRFGDALVLQPNAAWAERLLGPLVAALAAETGAATILKSASGRTRALEGLDDADAVLRGGLEGPVPVPMNGAVYMADLAGGQKTGLYYDQRDNHAMVARLARGSRVLDVFCHVGGFSLAALAAGAKEALAVDGSEPALDLAEEGARRTGVAKCFGTRRGDVFAVLEELRAEDEAFDVVVCDPPAFAPTRAAREAGLRAYERVAGLAAPLVAPGGYLVLCSCSYSADLAAFRNASARGIGKAGRRGPIVHTGFAAADHPLLPQLAEAGYLKALVFRL